jgi:hypothetical protein
VGQLAAYPEPVNALVLHNIERHKLSREQKRRLKAQKVTYYRRLQVQWPRRR